MNEDNGKNFGIKGLILVALIAGTVSGLTFLLLSYVIGLNLSRFALRFSAVAVGISVAFAVEGILRKEPLKHILLKIFLTLIGVAIAYCFIWWLKL
ncbi:hypothetical protein [Methanofervidicoccus abyssi]|nr:hypothetical protein [Methanofervidicoccus abyssi]